MSTLARILILVALLTSLVLLWIWCITPRSIEGDWQVRWESGQASVHAWCTVFRFQGGHIILYEVMSPPPIEHTAREEWGRYESLGSNQYLITHLDSSGQPHQVAAQMEDDTIQVQPLETNVYLAPQTWIRMKDKETLREMISTAAPLKLNK